MVKISFFNEATKYLGKFSLLLTIGVHDLLVEVAQYFNRTIEQFLRNRSPSASQVGDENAFYICFNYIHSLLCTVKLLFFNYFE